MLASYRMSTPLSKEDVGKLLVGDSVYIDGTIYTARDQAHKRAIELLRQGKPIPVNFEGAVVYHCGPIVKKEDGRWLALAAGPTTSARMELYEDEFIANLRPGLIAGKGGMGARTAEACRRYGAVVCDITGGAAVVIAKAISSVKGVEWFDLGMAEAVWIFEVRNFGPLTVTIDTTGRNLHTEIVREAAERKREIFKKLGIPLL